MSESDTIKGQTTKHKPKFSLERFLLVLSVSLLISVIVGSFIPKNVSWANLIPVLMAVFATEAVLNFRDAHRRGEMSASDMRKKSIKVICVMLVLGSVLMAPAFIWPEHAFKIVVAIGLLGIVVGSVQSLIQWRKRRAAAKQVVPADSQGDSK